MFQVDVTVATRKYAIDRALLARAANVALEGRIGSALVSLIVVGDARMRALNGKMLGHDYVTDVISTDHGGTPEGRLIELIVCAPFAARQARAHDLPLQQEFARYVIHGCLHCAGFDDRTPKQRATLWREQERLMRRLFGTAYCQATP